MSNTTLIFLASNRKGDFLYEELARHFATHYIAAGYDSLGTPLRFIPRLLRKFGPRLKNIAPVESKLRRDVERRAYQQAALIADSAPGPVRLFFWHNLFPISEAWARLGPNSLMTDVAMNEEYFEHFEIRSPRARAMRQKMWRASLDHCDWVFTHSEWAAKANRMLHPDQAAKFRRVGWGSDLPPLSPEFALNSRPRPQIISIGHDYYRKGMDRYNEVAGRLKQQIPGVECLVVGEPGRKLSPRQLPHLTVLGPLKRDVVGKILSESILFLLFSRFEPAGHVTLEAMSYGLPVICSSGGGLAEPVVDRVTGFVCSPWSVDVAVERSLCLLNHPHRLAEFRQNAYEHVVRNWQWDQVANNIAAVWESRPLTLKHQPVEIRGSGEPLRNRT